MVKFCCVPYCRSRIARDNSVLFHPFPLSKTLRKQWSLVVQQQARKSSKHPLVIKEHTKVCSKHFLTTDYWNSGSILKLRKNAVPTIFSLSEKKVNVSSKEKSEPNQNTVLKKNKLKESLRIQMKKRAKAVFTVKISPPKLKHLDKKRAKDSKEINKFKDPQMIQNCRNLLLITKDHAYAAFWQNESIENKKDSSSEDETDNDDPKDIPCVTNVEDTTTDMQAQEQVVLPHETLVEEAAPISANENNTEISIDTEIQNNMELVTDAHEITESVFLKEEIIEESPLNIEDVCMCQSANSIKNSNAVDETVVSNQVAESQKVTSVATNEENKNISNIHADVNVSNTNTLPEKTPKRVNTISQKNLPEICILCATANMTRKNYTLIVHFAAIIMDLSGVDILKSNVAPIACNVCFKNVLEMWNFKQQIVAADKFISENIPKQLPIHTNSRNVPKPTEATFEYIDCNKQNLNNTLIDSENQRQPENIDDLSEITILKKSNTNQDKVKNSLTTVPKSKRNLPQKDNGITFVLIEDILKDNNTKETNDQDFNDIDSESSEDSLDLPTCTDCGNTLPNINTKNCNCKNLVKNNAQPEKFVCSTCGKQYPLLRSLKRHEITHKKKQCLCTVCGQVFHFPLYLKRHMRKHSGKKPYVCSYCNKKFSSQWNLSQHKRLHTNSLPYECKLCPTAFRHNITLKKHIRLFHTADQMMQNSQHAATSSAISVGNN